MRQLVAYYDENPVEVKGKVEVHQSPMSSAAGSRSVEGVIRTSLVYVLVPSEAGPFLVPFGVYDEWSLRDRYNEAIRIMNTLGASAIACETFREVAVRRGVRARVLRRGGELTQQRLENSGFDFRHSGAGSAPRDPRPLRWPDEPGFSAAVTSVLENRATEVDINIRSTAPMRSMAPSESSSRISASTWAGGHSNLARPVCTSAPASRRAASGGSSPPALQLPRHHRHGAVAVR